MSRKTPPAPAPSLPSRSRSTLRVLALSLGLACTAAQAAPAPIRVVMDDNYPPYAFRDGTGALQGIVKDRWALWEARTGIKVELLAMDWAKAQATIQSGGADVIDTIFQTPARDAIYEFSAPYANLDVALIFNKSISGINDAVTARGFQVAIKEGDACAEFLQRHGVTDLKPFTSYQAMVGAASQGEIKVMCIDTPPAQYLLHKERVADQFRLTQPLFTGQFHWAVRKGDDKLKETIERGFSLVSEAELAHIESDWKGSALDSMAWSERLRYGLYALLGFGALSAFLAAWALLLRRQVAAKTKDLTAALVDLKTSQTKFQALFECATDAIILMDGERCVDCNERATQLYRVPREQFIGLTPLDFAPELQPDGKSSVDHLAALLARVRAGEVVVFEWRNILRDGSQLDVEVSWSQLTVLDFVYQQAIIRDIGARKRVEHELDQHRHHLQTLVENRTSELAASEERFRGLVEQSLVGIVIIANGRFAYVNKAFAQIFGYDSPEELLGLASIEELIVPESRTHVLEAIRLRLSGEVDSIQYEATGLKRDGSPVGIEIYGRRIDYQGHTATIGMVMDVSQRRALDEARELSLKEAEHLARVRSEFLANMSHEIRTPLNGVLGLARMGYRASPEGSEGRSILAKIISSGLHLLGVLNDVLDFSKIEAGQLSLESVVVDTHALLEECMYLVQESAAAKGILLTLRIDADLPALCLGDPLRLKQVLTNLLSNAVKFTPSGTVTLTATRQHESMVLTVTDTGIGISPDEIASLFKAFHQADASTTRRFGGSGLGLTICKRLIDLMNGTIQVSSVPGEGSCFEVHVPYRASGNQPPPDTAPNLQPGDGTRLQGVRILVAEDNEVNQMVIESMLTNEGAEPVLVGNGQEAVEQVVEKGAQYFQLALMDIQMPVMDGYEAARRIHTLAPDLPIIGQTAHALPEDRKKCLAAGMVDHIAKPFEPDALIRILHSHLGPASGQAGVQ